MNHPATDSTPFTTTPMHRPRWGAGALAMCLGLALPGIAAAQPSYEVIPVNGSEEFIDFETEYVQLKGLDSGVVQQEVNGRLRRAVLGHVTSARAMAQEYGLDGLGLKHSLTVSSHVRSLTSEIASIELQIYTYTGGAHGNSGFEVFNLDLTDGSRIEADALFGPEDWWHGAAIEVETALREKYTEADGSYPFDPVGPDDIGHIAIEPSGLRFLFPPYAIGPYAAGPAEVTVPFGRLAGLVDYRIVAPFAEEEGLPTLDLGNRGQLVERYLSALETRLGEALNSVGWEERQHFQAEIVRWPESGGAEALIAALRVDGLEAVAGAVREAHAESWSEHLDAAALAEVERGVIINTIRRAFDATAAGRIMARSDETVPLRDDAGQVIAELYPQHPVAVVAPTPIGAAQRLVRTASGDTGWVAGNQVLVERAISVRGTVVRTPAGLGLRAGSQVIRLLPKDGPHAPDATLDELRSVVGVTVVVNAIERTIGNRYWFAPRSFDLVEAAVAGAEGEGLVDELERIDRR